MGNHKDANMHCMHQDALDFLSEFIFLANLLDQQPTETTNTQNHNHNHDTCSDNNCKNIKEESNESKCTDDCVSLRKRQYQQQHDQHHNNQNQDIACRSCTNGTQSSTEERTIVFGDTIFINASLREYLGYSNNAVPPPGELLDAKEQAGKIIGTVSLKNVDGKSILNISHKFSSIITKFFNNSFQL